MDNTIAGDRHDPEWQDGATTALDTPPTGSTGGADAVESGSELPIRFTASGSEYFRIWIVNLLLKLVTLGLYHPWAKVRKLRYFYGNTWVGDHAFDFHGDPRRMLRGTLLVGVLLVAYSAAGHFSPNAGMLAVVIVAAVWPALFRASMRFRLANTSWRGMRFQFKGDMGGAYMAMLPAMLPAMGFAGLALFAPDALNADTPNTTGPAWVDMSMGGVMLATLALVPLMVWSVKRYQHNHYALGRVQSELRAGPGSFYGLFAKAFGVSLLTSVVVILLGLILGLVFGLGAFISGPSNRSGGAATAVVVSLLVMAGYVALIVVSNTYMASRFQNLVWGRTESTEFRFESRLRLSPLMRLTIKNWLLIMLTLGLYWPFAAVAIARLKLQAVTVYTHRPVNTLRGRAGLEGETDASGDAAGDVFGLDFGL